MQKEARPVRSNPADFSHILPMDFRSRVRARSLILAKLWALFPAEHIRAFAAAVLPPQKP